MKTILILLLLAIAGCRTTQQYTLGQLLNQSATNQR